MKKELTPKEILGFIIDIVDVSNDSIRFDLSRKTKPKHIEVVGGELSCSHKSFELLALSTFATVRINSKSINPKDWNPLWKLEVNIQNLSGKNVFERCPKDIMKQLK